MKAPKKINMRCPMCGQIHDVELRERTTSIEIKELEVEYFEEFYFCENSDEEENEFMTSEMLNQSLLNARNAYRIAKGLLTSNEIVELRENYGLSQVDLARLLGWGEATISRYESKAIQDDAYDAMLRLVKDNPLQALEFLRKNKNKFTESKYNEVKLKMKNKLDLYGKEYLTRQTLESDYTNYEEPSDYNGFTSLNIDKLEAMVSYMAERVSNLYKVKLMKMLWYSDVISYNKLGHSMSGLVYVHDTMGALAVGHHNVMGLEKIHVEEELSHNYDPIYHVLPTEGMNYDILTAEEKEILDAVIKKFKEYKAKDIIEYMHKETAYKKTKKDEIIPYSLAQNLREDFLTK